MTLNEQQDLPGCLDSLEWADDIHVVDSGSTDKTLEIANDINAKTYYNKFTGFGDQRNWSLKNCSLKYDWILFLDADERSTSAFKDSLISNVNSVSLETIGFYLCSKTILNGSWLRYSDNFPKWQFRLVKKDKGFFINAGHGQKESGDIKHIKYINEPYIHLAFSKGWKYWHEKHKQYAINDAKQLMESKVLFRTIFSSSKSQRNLAIKYFARRVPGWPYIRFLITYLFQRGFIDGKYGLFYCKKMLWYEKQIQKSLKYRTIK
ncbi:glycosyltransferase family 2 protein [Synechococcus sp. AH-224-G16]|nr:glycosyltransferase family 2 protein [Synechococcus sp. AH-224-G16]